VVGALLDAEAEDGFVNNLILSVRSLVPVEALVAEVEQRNKLKMLNPFLEQLVSEGSKVRGGEGCAERVQALVWCFVKVFYLFHHVHCSLLILVGIVLRLSCAGYVRLSIARSPPGAGNVPVLPARTAFLFVTTALCDFLFLSPPRPSCRIPRSTTPWARSSSTPTTTRSTSSPPTPTTSRW
jgi:hypothetical protein